MSNVPDGRNGCDTRNDILRRDLTNITLKPNTSGCVVARGRLADPYTATLITFVRGAGTSSLVQIDHVVALGDAWQPCCDLARSPRCYAYRRELARQGLTQGPPRQ
jgi:hypothetical protein